MGWEQADRYLTGIGGTRNRRLIAQQTLHHAQALANQAAQQQFERGVSIAAAGMVGTNPTGTGAVKGGGSTDTIVEAAALNDNARQALATADRHMAEALTKLRAAVEIWAEYARLAHTAAGVAIAPRPCCQPTWEALHVDIDIHVHQYRVTPDADPIPVGEPVYNFARRRGRLPTVRELEQWLANDRRWPARGKKNR